MTEFQFNSGNRIDYNLFKQKMDNVVFGESKFKPMFSIFDENGSQKLEGDNLEVSNFFSALSDASGDDNILTLSEFKKMLKEHGLKNLSNVEEIYNEFKTYFNSESSPHITQLAPVVTTSQGYPVTDIKTAAINTLSNDARAASETYNHQINTEGKISAFVDGVKVFFDTENASPKVEFAIKLEEHSSNLIRLASDGNLSVKDYYQKKIDFFMANFPIDDLDYTECPYFYDLIRAFGVDLEEAKSFLGIEYSSRKDNATLKQEIIEALYKKMIETMTPEEVTKYVNTLKDALINNDITKCQSLLETMARDFSGKYNISGELEYEPQLNPAYTNYIKNTPKPPYYIYDEKEERIQLKQGFLNDENYCKKLEKAGYAIEYSVNSEGIRVYSGYATKTTIIEKPNPKYDQYINNMPDQYGETPTEPTGGSVTIGNKNPNITSVSNLSSPQIMTFEECFRLERGVEYNPELVAVYTEKNTTFELMAGLHNRNEAIKQSFNIIEQMEELSETYHFNLKEGNYTDMGGLMLECYIPHCKSLGLPINPKDWGKLVQQNIVESLKMMFGKDVQKAEAYLKQMTNGIDIGWTFSTNQDGEFNITFSNNDLIKSIQIAKNIMQFSNTQYTNALGGKTLEQYSQEASDAYKAAFGKNSVVEVANDFVQSQKEGTGYVKAGVAGIGFVCTVAGTLVPGAQGLVWAGMGLLTVGGTTVSAIENFTKEGGPTEQDWKDMGKELATSLALMGTGMGIGRVSESLFMYMVVRNCPKVLAFLSEVGIDAGLSMMADFIITGEIDLSGEGIAQMLNVLMGIKFGKSNFKEFLNTHAGDIDVARNRYLQENFGLEDQVKQMYKDAGMDYETPPAVKSNETLNDARFETKSQEVSPSGTNTKSKTKSKDQNTPTELTESLSVPDRNIIRHDKSTGNENLINNLTPKAKNKDELVEFFGHLNEIGKNDPEFRKTFTDALNKYLKNNPNAEIDFASYNELLSIAKKYSDHDLSLVKFFGDRDLFTCIENGINPKALNTIINNPEIRLGTQIYKDIIAGKFDNIIDKIDYYFISSYYDKNILIVDHPEMKDDIESIWNSLCKDLESSTSEELNGQIQSDMYDIMKFFLYEYKNIINIKDCKNLLNKGAHITQIANIIRYNSAYDELKQMGGKCAKFADELKTALYKNKYEGYSAEDLNSITKLLYDNIDMLNNNKIGINTEECIKLIKDNTNINSLGYLIGHPEVEVDSHLWTVARSSYLSKFLDNIENNHQAKALLKLMSEGFLTKLDDFETSMIIKFVNDDASFSDLAKLLDVESNDFNIIVKTLNEKYGNNTTTQELDLAIENRNYISRNLDKNPYTYNEEIVEAIERIKANLSHIDDLEVLKYIRTLDLNSSDDLLEIERLIDSFNTLDGKYEMYKVRHFDEIAYWAYRDYEDLFQSQKAVFITWLRSTDPELYKALVNGDKNVKISSDDIAKFNEYRNTHTLTADFTTVARTEEMVRYIGKYPDSPMANHLYNKYLEQQKGIWPDDIINQCKALNDRYGTKVVLGAHYIDETKEVLEFIDNELSCWVAASNGKAKIPPAFDFNNFNQAWYDKSEAYGLSVAGAHSRALYGGTIGSSETSVSMMKWALRHEMTHTNDLGQYVNIAPEIIDAIMPKKTIISNGETTLIPDIKNGKYYQELRNAGLENYRIEYAYTNRDEFLAVAAEGDMSKYSPEFKAILVDMGMPHWLFDIDTPDVKAKAADIRNGNSNITPIPRTLSNENNTSNYNTTPISGDNNIYIKQNQDLEEITTRAINNKKAGNDPSDFGIDTDQLIEALYIKGDYTKIQELNNAGIKHSSNTELQNIGKQ